MKNFLGDLCIIWTENKITNFKIHFQVKIKSSLIKVSFESALFERQKQKTVSQNAHLSLFPSALAGKKKWRNKFLSSTAVYSKQYDCASTTDI